LSLSCVAIAVIAVIGFVACDSSLVAPAPDVFCTESGRQCQLPDGPLGVCERSACASGDTPPCFQCVSQH
jgi:hypothetical protein